jgi:hypothetical protein
MGHILKFKDYQPYNEEFLGGLFGSEEKTSTKTADTKPKSEEQRLNNWIETVVNQSLSKQGQSTKAAFNAQKGVVVLPLGQLNISIVNRIREDLLESADGFLQQNPDIEASDLVEFYDNWADSMFNSVKNANNGPLSWSQKSREFYSDDFGKSNKISIEEVYQKYYKD